MGEAGCEPQLVSSQPVSYSELGLPTSCWMACSAQVWKGLTLAGWTVGGGTTPAQPWGLCVIPQLFHGHFT